MPDTSGALAPPNKPISLEADVGAKVGEICRKPAVWYLQQTPQQRNSSLQVMLWIRFGTLFCYQLTTVFKIKQTCTRTLRVCVHTHGSRLPYRVLTYTDKFSFHLRRRIKMYLFLPERTACTLEKKGILVQFRCNTGIILTTEIHWKYISVSFYNHCQHDSLTALTDSIFC